MNEANERLLMQELQWIRKLLTLNALALGFKQKDIAGVLGISPATMSRMMPKGLRLPSSPTAEKEI